MRARITRRAIEAMPAPAIGQAWLHDTEVRGFSVLCQVSGRKSYIVRYRAPSGALRKKTIAMCSEMRPEDAREQARQMIVASRKGVDPVRDRNVTTVEQLSERFMAEHAAKLKTATRSSYAYQWKRINSVLGRLSVVDVRAADIEKFHASRKATPYAANRCIEILRTAFELAERWGVRAPGSNPCKHIEAYPEKARAKTLTVEDIGRLWNVLDRCAHPSATIIKLLILTGCRVSEIRRAKWDWFEDEHGILRLPDSKTGARAVVLPPPALELLRSLPRTSKFIIGGANGNGVPYFFRVWSKLRKEAGLDGVRLHDLRHTVGSLAHRAGLSVRDIADLLGHKELRTTERYINSAEPHKAESARIWGEVVSTAIRQKGGSS